MATLGLYSLFLNNPTPYIELKSIMKELTEKLEAMKFTILNVHFSADETLDIQEISYDTKDGKYFPQIEKDLQTLKEYIQSNNNISYFHFEFNL